MLKNWLKQLRIALGREYRLTLRDDHTLHIFRQYRFRMIRFVIAAVLFFLVVVVSTTCIIMFTPFIREQIPGYEDPELGARDKVRLLQKIDTLEYKNAQLDTMLMAFKQLVGGGDFPAVPASVSSGSAASRPAAPTQAVSIYPEPEPAAVSTLQGNYTPSLLSANPSYEALRLFQPVRGKLRRPFDPAGRHFGMDLVTDGNPSVLAATHGVVFVAEYSDRDGYVIGITSPNGIITLYKHNDRLLKRIGAPVRAGEAIAVVGNTGENTTGPHLHFELWLNGVPVDPAPYIGIEQ